jgi:AAA domain
VLTVAVLQQKGGSGKTTLAINLAAAAHLDGGRALVVDMDRQASAFDWERSAAGRLAARWPRRGQGRPGDGAPALQGDVPGLRLRSTGRRAWATSRKALPSPPTSPCSPSSPVRSTSGRRSVIVVRVHPRRPRARSLTSGPSLCGDPADRREPTSGGPTTRPPRAAPNQPDRGAPSTPPIAAGRGGFGSAAGGVFR